VTEPDLLRLIDIGRYLRVTKQRAYQLSLQHGFPRPSKRLSSGRLWKPSAVERPAISPLPIQPQRILDLHWTVADVGE
jgi:hypothetical protein